MPNARPRLQAKLEGMGGHARPTGGRLRRVRQRLTRRSSPPQNRWRRRLRHIAIVLVIVLVGFCAVTARWFVWPEQGMPSHVDAIVMLNGLALDNRVDTALELAREHRASVVVISYSVAGPHWSNGSACAPKVTYAKVICFIPNPPTTLGEAEFIGRLASQYRWHSIVLVAIAPQDPVALLRVGRCFSGKIYVIDAPLPASEWPYEIVHYWGGTLRALLLQRSC